MNELIKILHDGDYSCVVRNYDETYTFTQRGVSDLYDMVKNKPGFLKGASIADKVVGKAAAALMILGGIDQLYTDIISLSALILLREASIEADFKRVVPFISNRDKTGWCPLERLCYNESSAEAILPLIDEFLNKMQNIKESELAHI
ncbi:DUF1893 domain-containing protein [uncultured Dysgonomonas sp.]|uniref:Putative TonB-dependent outer membrane receptor n=1 Tax=uncultured Dysgonomonas sp. TaxID=206096 RepID=A0A212IVG1_9BACT|nr:DUF1893 domain-containing protein [uncultured Dysgonomonas sp.]SBV91149.1 putative TonB-dependent outer membrane receptor [uncultured Dysgonomonas sp.]